MSTPFQEEPASIQAEVLIQTAKQRGEAPILLDSPEGVQLFGAIKPIEVGLGPPYDSIFLMRIKVLPIDNALRRAILHKLKNPHTFRSTFNECCLGGLHVVWMLDYEVYPLPFELEALIKSRLESHKLEERHPLTGELIPANVIIHVGSDSQI